MIATHQVVSAVVNFLDRAVVLLATAEVQVDMETVAADMVVAETVGVIVVAVASRIVVEIVLAEDLETKTITIILNYIILYLLFLI